MNKVAIGIGIEARKLYENNKPIGDGDWNIETKEWETIEWGFDPRACCLTTKNDYEFVALVKDNLVIITENTLDPYFMQSICRSKAFLFVKSIELIVAEEKFEELLEPLGLWDKKNFGVWVLA